MYALLCMGVCVRAYMFREGTGERDTANRRAAAMVRLHGNKISLILLISSNCYK